MGTTKTYEKEKGEKQMSSNILTAHDLCKSFAHNGGQVHVLSHIDLEIKE